jgi:hypothetical protein
VKRELVEPQGHRFGPARSLVGRVPELSGRDSPRRKEPSSVPNSRPDWSLALALFTVFEIRSARSACEMASSTSMPLS